MSEENTNSTESLEPQGEATESSEIIDLEWSEVEQIYDLREEYVKIETHFSKLCVNFEKRKAQLLKAVSEYETAMFSLANQLKAAKNISPELTYELKLPQTPEGKAYFLRKDT